MLYFITGVCGFIGFHLANSLLVKGKKVIGLDHMNDYIYDVKWKLANLKELKGYPDFIFLEEDIITTKAIEIYKPDYIIHLAGLAGVRHSMDNPMLYCRTNVEGSVNLLNQCTAGSPCKLFLYASSSSVYGDSLEKMEETASLGISESFYACSKQMQETVSEYYRHQFSIPAIGMRFFTVYGPNGRTDMAALKFITGISQGETISKFGDGTSFRDYTYIDDLIQGIHCLLNGENHQHSIYNIGSGKSHTLNEFIETIEKVVDKKAKIQELEFQKGDVQGTLASITRIQKEFGYLPTFDLSSGMTQTYLWYQSLKNINI